MNNTKHSCSKTTGSEVVVIILSSLDWPRHGKTAEIMRVVLRAGPIARSALLVGERFLLSSGGTLTLAHRLNIPSARNAIRRLIPLTDSMALSLPIMHAAFEAADENEFEVWIVRPEMGLEKE